MWISDFPAVEWLRLQTSSAGCMGSIPGQGNMIPRAICMAKQNKTWRISINSGKPSEIEIRKFYLHTTALKKVPRKKFNEGKRPLC